MAKLLLASGAELDARNSWDGTSLFLAAYHGHKNLAELLLASGAEVDAKTGHGATPLHTAAANGHEDVTKLLLASGAKVNANNNSGETPLRLAASGGHKDLAELLCQLGGMAPELASLTSFEAVGAWEIAFLLVIGLVTTTGFILAFGFDQPLIIKVIAGMFAVFFALPWLGIGAFNFLFMMFETFSAVAPMSQFRKPITTPKLPVYQLLPPEAQRFRQQPLINRLRDLYLLYAKHGANRCRGCLLLAFDDLRSIRRNSSTTLKNFT